MHRFAPNETIECGLLKRKPNSFDYENQYMSFHAEIVEDLKKQKYEIISGTVAVKTSMVIKSSNCPYDIKADDKIKVFGTERLVSFVLISLSDLELTLNNKFSTEEIFKTAPKIIGLGS